MQNVQCVLAAIINIIVSIGFIPWLGIHSIVLGSVVGTLIIFVMNMYQMFKNVLHGNWKNDVKNIILNYVAGIGCICVFYRINISVTDYFQWILVACGTCVIMGAVFVLINFIFDYQHMKKTANYILQSTMKMLKR